MKKTIRERLAAILEGKEGLTRSIAHISRKYWVYPIGDGTNYYLGKSGSLRRGSTIAGSISISAKTFLMLNENAPVG